MTPYYEDEWVTLWHGDCLENPEWWTGADVLVTDPPYGIGFQISSLGKSSAYRTKHMCGPRGIQNDEDTTTRDEALAAWGERPAIVFGSFFAPMPPKTRHVGVYKKPKNSGSTVGFAGLRRDVEALYFLGDAPGWKRGGGRRTSVFATRVARAGGGNRRPGNGEGLVQKYQHPHAKPGDVLQELILLTPPGLIADPFAGSGSTLVSAKALGRHAVGVELEERYCEVAANRLSQDVLDFGGAA